MSFDYNPYKHIELTKDDDGFINVYCHSCGSEKVNKDVDLIPDGPMGQAFLIMAEHVEQSHNLSRDEVKDWSVL